MPPLRCLSLLLVVVFGVSCAADTQQQVAASDTGSSHAVGSPEPASADPISPGSSDPNGLSLQAEGKPTDALPIHDLTEEEALELAMAVAQVLEVEGLHSFVKIPSATESRLRVAVGMDELGSEDPGLVHKMLTVEAVGAISPLAFEILDWRDFLHVSVGEPIPTRS